MRSLAGAATPTPREEIVLESGLQEVLASRGLLSGHWPGATGLPLVEAEGGPGLVPEDEGFAR